MMVLCLLLVTGCSTVADDDDVVERVSVGDRVPSFTVQVTDGDRRYTFSTADLKGEAVIVFFNTTCPDCQRDLPLLNDFYLQHRDEADFRMVAISREEGEGSVAAFWQANGLSIPFSAQTDRRVYGLFASSVIPRIYFVSQGIVTRIDVERFNM